MGQKVLGSLEIVVKRENRGEEQREARRHGEREIWERRDDQLDLGPLFF